MKKLCAIMFALTSLNLYAQNVEPPIYDFFNNARWSFSAWGAANYSFKSTYSSAVDSAMSNNGTYFLPRFGLDAWYGNKSQIGLSASYWVVYSNNATVYGTDQTDSLKYIPLVVTARRYIVDSVLSGALWVGAGVGGALTMLSVATPSSTTAYGFAPLVALKAGYDYRVWQNLTVSGFIDFTYAFTTINQQVGTSAAANYNASSFNISPGISVTWRL